MFFYPDKYRYIFYLYFVGNFGFNYIQSVFR